MTRIIADFKVYKEALDKLTPTEVTSLPYETLTTLGRGSKRKLLASIPKNDFWIMWWGSIMGIAVATFLV